MEDLNSAKLDEFQAFYKKYYVPNNATLVVAGDIKPAQTKNGYRNIMVAFQKEPLVLRTSRKMNQLSKKKKLQQLTPIYSFLHMFLLTEHYLIKKETHMYSICFRLI